MQERIKTNKEYPASHSVDTDWYAVDKNGNIGLMKADANGALPLLLSADDLESEDKMFDCFIEMSELVEPNCYYLPMTEKSVEKVKKWILEYGYKDINNPKLYWSDKWGQSFITNGCSFRELDIWKNRKPETLFFFMDTEETIFTVYNIALDENVRNDFDSGKIICTDRDSFDDKTGIVYCGDSPNGNYYREMDDEFEVRILPLKKKSFKHIVPIDASFETDEKICLLDQMYVHYPRDNSDPYPVEELRHKFSQMTQKERIEYLFNSTYLSDDENRYDDYTGREIGILLSEFNVSPYDKNENGETAIDCARRKLKKYDSEKCWIDKAFFQPIVRMLELKEKELCSKSDK